MYHDLSDLRSWIVTQPKSDVLTLQWLQQLTVVLANLFLQSIRLPFLALLLAVFVCFTFRLRDENINGPEEPASELVRDFFPTGFKWVAKGWTLKDLWKVNYARFFNRNFYALNMRATSCH